jgi:hypothetical protein
VQEAHLSSLLTKDTMSSFSTALPGALGLGKPSGLARARCAVSVSDLRCFEELRVAGVADASSNVGTRSCGGVDSIAGGCGGLQRGLSMAMVKASVPCSRPSSQWLVRIVELCQLTRRPPHGELWIHGLLSPLAVERRRSNPTRDTSRCAIACPARVGTAGQRTVRSREVSGTSARLLNDGYL